MNSVDALLGANDSIVRTWDVRTMRTHQDALQVRIGDTLQYDQFTLVVTWLSPDTARERVFMGHVHGPNKWQFTPGQTLVWGPKGFAHNYELYSQGRYLCQPDKVHYEYWDD